MTWSTIEPEVVYVYRHELERLRRIEEAAREALAAMPIFGVRPESVWQRLRAALQPEGSAQG